MNYDIRNPGLGFGNTSKAAGLNRVIIHVCYDIAFCMIQAITSPYDVLLSHFDPRPLHTHTRYPLSHLAVTNQSILPSDCPLYLVCTLLLVI